MGIKLYIYLAQIGTVFRLISIYSSIRCLKPCHWYVWKSVLNFITLSIIYGDLNARENLNQRRRIHANKIYSQQDWFIVFINFQLLNEWPKKCHNFPIRRRRKKVKWSMFHFGIVIFFSCRKVHRFSCELFQGKTLNTLHMRFD